MTCHCADTGSSEWKGGEVLDAVGAICVGLKVDINSYVPKEWYENCEEADAFTAVCVHRYHALGCPSRLCSQFEFARPDGGQLFDRCAAPPPESPHRLGSPPAEWEAWSDHSAPSRHLQPALRSLPSGARAPAVPLSSPAVSAGPQLRP